MQTYVQADDTIESIIEKYPISVSFLARKHLKCIQCGEPFWGTIGELIREKNLDVPSILDELNQAIQQSQDTALQSQDTASQEES